MMKLWAVRLVGFILLVGAIGGWFLSAFGVWWIWREVNPVSTQVDSALVWMDETFTVVSATLGLADDTLKFAKETTALIDQSLKDTAVALRNSSSLASSASLTARDSAGMIEETRASLDGVRSGMKLVDNVLRVISGIPFIGAEYTPRESLDTSITRVSDSLSPLPASIRAVQKDLQSTSTQLDLLIKDLEALSIKIQGVDQNIVASRLVVQNYVNLVNKAHNTIVELRKSAPRLVMQTAWVGTGFLVWIFLVNISLAIQAISWIRQVPLFHGVVGTNQ